MSKSLITSLLVVAVFVVAAVLLIKNNPKTAMQNPTDSTGAAANAMSEENNVPATDQTGAEAKAGDTVSVEYTGKLTDGTVFDSNVGKNRPLEFQLGAGQMIEGFDKGILGMKVGEKKTLTIPSAQAYGEAGRPPVIPPNSDLVFEVELLSIK